MSPVGNERREHDRGGVARIWDMTTGTCVNVIDEVCYGLGGYDCARSMQWSRDGRHAVCFTAAGQVMVWELSEEPILKSTMAAPDETVGCSSAPGT